MKTVGEKSSVSSNLTVSAKILKRLVMIGKPKFDYNDEVIFEIDYKKPEKCTAVGMPVRKDFIFTDKQNTKVTSYRICKDMWKNANGVFCAKRKRICKQVF